MRIAKLRQFAANREKLAADIVAELTQYEHDLAKALASGSRLQALIPVVRIDADVSAVIGQDAIDHFTSSTRLVSKAMRKSVKGHNSLAGLAEKFRIDVRAAGDKGTIPPLMAGEPHLRAVASGD